MTDAYQTTPSVASSNRNLVLRELVSGGLLAGGLFWIVFSLALLAVEFQVFSHEKLTQTVELLRSAFSGVEIDSRLLLILLASGLMMLWQSNALNRRVPWGPALMLSGIVALGLQLYSVLNGAYWTSGIFSFLIVAGLLLSLLWLKRESAATATTAHHNYKNENSAAEHNQHGLTKNQEPTAESAVLPSAAALSATHLDGLSADTPDTETLNNPVFSVVEPEVPVADEVVNGMALGVESPGSMEEPMGQIDEALSLNTLTADEPSHARNGGLGGVFTSSLASENQERKVMDTQELEAIKTQTSTGESASESVLEPLFEVQDFHMPGLESTQEMAAVPGVPENAAVDNQSSTDLADSQVSGVEDKIVLSQSNIIKHPAEEPKVQQPTLESTQELDVPELTAIPFTNPDDDIETKQALPELEKTLVMERPVFSDDPEPPGSH